MSQIRFFGEGLPYLEAGDCPGVLITIEGTDGVGRSTQVAMLRDWLELQGYGVVETGWSRSPLIGRAIDEAKQLRVLNRYTYSLLYAADFADRLEKAIIPALRGGFVVLADRYVYTAFARDIIRGADRQWVKDLLGFAPIPHLVLYLKVDLNTLVHRTIARGPLDYFEAGMDMRLADDPYESFRKYQTLLIREYNRMAKEFNFHTVSAKLKPNLIQKKMRDAVSEFFREHRFLGMPTSSRGPRDETPESPPLPVPAAHPSVIPAGLSA
jgi:dTMP kinase